MTRRVGWWRGLLAATALLGACARDPGRAPPGDVHAEPTALEDALLYVASRDDGETHEAVLLDLASGRPILHRYELPVGKSHVYTRPGSVEHEAVLLSEGREAAVEDGNVYDKVSSCLILFDREGEQARYELGARFSALALSEDGRFAVAYAPIGAFESENFIAVVDFQKPPSAALLGRTVLVDGEAADSFAFAPETDGGRRLLLMRMRNNVKLLDLEHPDRGAIMVPLVLPSEGRTVRPQTVLFARHEIYVQAEGSSDVYVIQLMDAPEALRGFRVSLSQLATGSEVRDIALTGEPDAPRLITVNAGALHIIEPLTGRSVRVGTQANFDSILQFEARSPVDDAVGRRAFLYSRSDPRVGFVDLDSNDALAFAEVELLELNGAVSRLVSLLSRDLAVAVHAEGRLSLIDLAHRSVSSVSTSESPTQTLLDEAHTRLWVTTADGSVGSIDLSTLRTSQLLLNGEARRVLSVPGARPRIAVLHPSASGHLTLLDAESPARDTARELVGFLWTDLFD